MNELSGPARCKYIKLGFISGQETKETQPEQLRVPLKSVQVLSPY
jgi:hypothetical protein